MTSACCSLADITVIILALISTGGEKTAVLCFEIWRVTLETHSMYPSHISPQLHSPLQKFGSSVPSDLFGMHLEPDWLKGETVCQLLMAFIAAKNKAAKSCHYLGNFPLSFFSYSISLPPSPALLPCTC